MTKNSRSTRFVAVTVALLFAALFSGCLTAEHKEIRLTLNGDSKSGSGSITFTKITSEPGEDTVNVSKEDFNSLIADYYQGKKIENANKGMHNVKKRLFLSGDDLMGEITFEFDDISKLGFYRHKGEGVFMYYTIGDGYFTSGQFESSNGTYGGEKMPMIFWDASTKDFYIKVALSTPNAAHHSLLKPYKDWSKKQ